MKKITTNEKILSITLIVICFFAFLFCIIPPLKDIVPSIRENIADEFAFVSDKSTKDNVNKIMDKASIFSENADMEECIFLEQEGSTLRIRDNAGIKNIVLIGVTCDSTTLKKVSDMVSVGDTMYIEYDKQKTDTDGNYYVYLYFSDKTMVQYWLLNKGYSTVVDSGENNKHLDIFNKFDTTNK